MHKNSFNHLVFSLFIISISIFVSTDSEARRRNLIPKEPSIEIHFEALKALEYSARKPAVINNYAVNKNANQGNNSKFKWKHGAPSIIRKETIPKKNVTAQKPTIQKAAKPISTPKPVFHNKVIKKPTIQKITKHGSRNNIRNVIDNSARKPINNVPAIIPPTVLKLANQDPEIKIIEKKTIINPIKTTKKEGNKVFINKDKKSTKTSSPIPKLKIENNKKPIAFANKDKKVIIAKPIIPTAEKLANVKLPSLPDETKPTKPIKIAKIDAAKNLPPRAKTVPKILDKQISETLLPEPKVRELKIADRSPALPPLLPTPDKNILDNGNWENLDNLQIAKKNNTLEITPIIPAKKNSKIITPADNQIRNPLPLSLPNKSDEIATPTIPKITAPEVIAPKLPPIEAPKIAPKVIANNKGDNKAKITPPKIAITDFSEPPTLPPLNLEKLDSPTQNAVTSAPKKPELPRLPSLDSIKSGTSNNKALEIAQKHSGGLDGNITTTDKPITLPQISAPILPPLAIKNLNEPKNLIKTPKEFEVAALPKKPELPKTSSSSGGSSNNKSKYVIEFAVSETDVPISSQPTLKEIANKLISDKDKDATVIAYASGGKDASTIAKRVSLARALSVRAFLIDLGVENIRIIVQAKGNKVTSGSPERADIIIN